MSLSIGGVKIVPGTVVAVLTSPNVKKVGDIFEVRGDLILRHGYNLESILQMARKLLPVILTVRDPKEGGEHIDNRLEVILEHIPFADVLDVEIRNARNFRHIFNAKPVILSYHSFRGIPRDIEDKVKKGFNEGADIVKVAVVTETQKDIVKLCLLTKKMSEMGLKIATLGMGKLAFISRVVLPLFGSLLVYGSVDKPTAPGQPSAEVLKRILKPLKLDELENHTKLF